MVLWFLLMIFSMVLCVFCCVELLVLKVIEKYFGVSVVSWVWVVCSFFVFLVVLGGKNLILKLCVFIDLNLILVIVWIVFRI